MARWVGVGRALARSIAMTTDAIEFVDCTLRDGEQAPGVWFTVEEKVAIAVALDAAGVDVLDAGFPAASEDDVEALQELKRLGLRAEVAATSRPLKGDVAAAARAGADALFMFLPVSDQHLDTKLEMSRERSLELLRGGLEAAGEAGLPVSFVAEDSSRADPDWLLQVVEVAMGYQPRRVVLCDTVGAALPHEMGALVARVRGVTGEVPICLHCHNDFGLASASTLEGVRAGARSVSCTVNGIGERAGNADLAEVSAGLEHLLGMRVRIAPDMLAALSDMVARASGVHSSPLKPVTGWNVYAHESGVHVDGMLKDARNYEQLPSAWSGNETRYVLGKHSGKNLLRAMLAEEGLQLDEEQLGRLLERVKQWATRRGKAEHLRMDQLMRRFQREQLAGVSRLQLLELVEELSSRPLRAASS